MTYEAAPWRHQYLVATGGRIRVNGQDANARDGIAVAAHDLALRDVNGGTRLIADSTLAELRATPGGATLATLDEVIVRCRSVNLASPLKVASPNHAPPLKVALANAATSLKVASSNPALPLKVAPPNSASPLKVALPNAAPPKPGAKGN